MTSGAPQDFDTALADYVHFRNASAKAHGDLRDAQAAVREKEEAVVAAEERLTAARHALEVLRRLPPAKRPPTMKPIPPRRS